MEVTPLSTSPALINTGKASLARGPLAENRLSMWTEEGRWDWGSGLGSQCHLGCSFCSASSFVLWG